MLIDLNKLNNSNIDISGKYDIPSSYYENSDIIRLDPIEVSGEIALDEEENEIIDCTIKGNMILPDTISSQKQQKKVKIYLIFLSFCGKILY